MEVWIAFGVGFFIGGFVGLLAMGLRGAGMSEHAPRIVLPRLAAGRVEEGG